MEQINVGDRVRDPISGYEGVVTARTEFLHGCVRIGVEGPDQDGKPQDRWFDEPRLEVTERRAFEPVLSILEQSGEPARRATGGPARETDPGRPSGSR